MGLRRRFLFRLAGRILRFILPIAAIGLFWPQISSLLARLFNGPQARAFFSKSLAALKSFGFGTFASGVGKALKSFVSSVPGLIASAVGKLKAI